MDGTVTPEELQRLEELPIEERAEALEEIERRLRSALEDAAQA